MTRQFRIAFFVALAGMVGLHVRPFIGCAVDALLNRPAEVEAASAAAVETAPTAGADAVEAKGQGARPALRAFGSSGGVEVIAAVSAEGR